MSRTYQVIIEEVTIHSIEVEANSPDEAEELALEGWRSGDLVDSDPSLDSLRALGADPLEVWA